ncbi:hypothetical protein IQ235_15550 [Oscillatoriales cyanobacterium LEGE 11467]|uniref:Uncharacterized protein n=1 Tax=Zarconia navalis LEGE 11467 TaxID=1828826 RepID=A0A928W1I7_9CYAN|nr:hypothetical protein [Zarconia navalis]MBE9042193.1 hypothetical protein [Zarconia navalis LEGE 11467]
MVKQISWLPLKNENGRKILHLRTDPHRPWQPYTAFPEYAVPDIEVAGASKGYATFQKLISQGWQVVATHRA